MAPLEPWEKVLVDGSAFPSDVHGHIGCTQCHLGDSSASEKSAAHVGLVDRPSNDPESSCAGCHPDVTVTAASSLHTTLAGYWRTLDTRSTPGNHAQLETMFGNHCSSCHASCGDCHVSQPGSVGGGFIEGHTFNAKPSMTRNCTACHGSRVGNEYLGKHEGLQADVHFRQGRMTCVDCHTGPEMHGQAGACETCHPGPEIEAEAARAPADHRYGGLQQPRCETCHTGTITGADDIEMHTVHGADLSCQVCHSVSYTSCDGCHVAISDNTGNPFFQTDGSYFTFLIGRNPQPSFDRPYRFVPVRHVPVDRDSYAYYGEDLLVNFDLLPTWAYATPHNIQLNTPQAESCDACHGNPTIFLTADKVSEDELGANASVIIETVPSPVESASDGMEEETPPGG